MPKKIPKKVSDSTDYSEVAKRIKPVAEQPSYHAALIYGRSGTGKTALAGTFPKPALLLDIRERGTDTVAAVAGLDVIAIETWEEIEQIYWMLASGKTKYKTIILDQVTMMQDLAMTSIKLEEGMTDSDPMSKRDWGTLSGRMKTWISNYRDLTDRGYHVVFLAHEREDDAEDSVDQQIMPSIGPRLMPSVASHMAGAASLIGNTFIRERFVGTERKRLVEYCIRIGPHAYYLTKVRHDVSIETPDILVNPTFEKLVAALRGEIKQPVRKVKRKSNAKA